MSKFSDRLTAPGVRPEMSERDRAISTARGILAPVISGYYSYPVQLQIELAALARQYLRAVGVSEKE